MRWGASPLFNGLNLLVKVFCGANEPPLKAVIVEVLLFIGYMSAILCKIFWGGTMESPTGNS